MEGVVGVDDLGVCMFWSVGGVPTLGVFGVVDGTIRNNKTNNTTNS